MRCINCGGVMVGDGFSAVLHCENVDYVGDREPDSRPVYCNADSPLCYDCNGTGEGRRDGSVCRTCSGTGEVAP